MLSTRSAALGAAGAVAARALLPHALHLKFDRDLRALNAGDYRPLLANYADDAVLRFAASSGYVVTRVRTGTWGASARNSSPSRRVRFATDRIERSRHRSS